MSTAKYQVNGLFEIDADNYQEALEILRNSNLKPIDIRILEVIILDNKEGKL